MRKKKIVCGLLFLVLAFGLCAPAWAVEEDGFVDIGSVAELELMRADPAGRYRLTADLDLTGVDWMPFDFQGVLDGAGHTVYNLTVTKTGAELHDTVDGNNKRYATSFAGFFAALLEAEVKDLNIFGVDVTVVTDRHSYAAPLAGYMDQSTVTNVTVTDARVSLTTTIQTNPEGPTNRCMAGVSGLVGFGRGTITGCTSESVLVFDDRSAFELKCEEFMGGILACGNATVTDCRVTIAGYDACRGYAHNGGLIGMFYRYDRSTYSVGKVANCAVDGVIHFFEDNPSDRRAYCAAYVGELLTSTSVLGCTQTFTRDEIFDYTADLRPETCETPRIEESSVSPDCRWGYTTHTCTICGNSWRDTFLAPEHAPGEWVVVQEASFETAGLRQIRCTLCGEVLRETVIPPHIAGDWAVAVEPGVGQSGLQQRLCVDCGVVLEEETLPALVGVERCALSEEQLKLNWGESARIDVQITPADASDTQVLWSSSAPEVAAVDAGGTVRAVRPGTAVIICASADGQAQSRCEVTVRYTFWQWLRHYILFGWLFE